MPDFDYSAVTLALMIVGFLLTNGLLFLVYRQSGRNYRAIKNQQRRSGDTDNRGVEARGR